MTSSAETWAIRDAIRTALSTRTPQSGPLLFRRVVDDQGHVNERRLWRALGWLCWRGIAVRLAPLHANHCADDAGYLRGTGMEYPRDAREREQIELAMAGRCRGCRRAGFDSELLAAYDGRCRACFLERHNHWQRERYLRLSDAGICPCGREEPAPGQARCGFCQEASMLAYYQKRSPDTAAEFIARYRARRAA